MADPIGISVALGAGGPLVESPTWTQLDATDNLTQSYAIRRGRTDEFERTGTGTASVRFNDTAGFFDPTNGADLEGKQAALALHNPVTDEWPVIFRGLIDEIPQEMDASQRVTFGQLNLVDGMDYLAGYELPPNADIDVFPAPTISWAAQEAIARLGDIFYPPTTEYAFYGGTISDQTVDRRILYVLDQAGWPGGSLRSVFTGNVKLRGRSYASGTTALTVIDDSADAEFPGIANRYISKTGAFVFHGRLARFDPTNPDYGITVWKAGDGAAVLADSDYAQIRGLRWSNSRQTIVNSAFFTFQGITDPQIPEMYVKDDTSIAAYGVHSKSAENLCILESVLTGNNAYDECIAFGNYWVAAYKDPQTRVNQIVFRSMRPDDPRAPAVWDLMCNVEISDIIRLKTTHPGGGGFADVDFFVEGISYDVSPLMPEYQNVVLTLDLSPRSAYDYDWTP